MYGIWRGISDDITGYGELDRFVSGLNRDDDDIYEEEEKDRWYNDTDKYECIESRDLSPIELTDIIRESSLRDIPYEKNISKIICSYFSNNPTKYYLALSTGYEWRLSDTIFGYENQCDGAVDDYDKNAIICIGYDNFNGDQDWINEVVDELPYSTAIITTIDNYVNPIEYRYCYGGSIYSYRTDKFWVNCYNGFIEVTTINFDCESG